MAATWRERTVRRVPQRLAAAELQLTGAQHHGVAAELGDPGLERHPGPRRGSLEDQRDCAALERARADRRLLELGRTVEQSPELLGAQLLAGEKVGRQAGECTLASMGLRVLTWNLMHGRSVPPAGHDLFEEFAAALAWLALGRGAASGGAAVVAAGTGRATAGERADGPHLAQRAAPPAARGRRAPARPDQVERRWRQRDPGAPRTGPCSRTAPGGCAGRPSGGGSTPSASATESGSATSTPPSTTTRAPAATARWPPRRCSTGRTGQPAILGGDFNVRGLALERLRLCRRARRRPRVPGRRAPGRRRGRGARPRAPVRPRPGGGRGRAPLAAPRRRSPNPRSMSSAFSPIDPRPGRTPSCVAAS